MALSQKHRSSNYQQLSPILGEEEAEALLSQFPARDLDEPVTKDFVRAELAELRAEVLEKFREQTMWMAGSMTVGMGLAAGIATLLG